MVRDYDVPEATGGHEQALASPAHGCPTSRLLEFEDVAEVLGYPRTVEPARPLRRAARLPRALHSRG